MNFMRIVRCASIAIALELADAIIPASGPAQAPPNIPPPGAYQPIPNFSGAGAGLQFRKAINDRFSGAQAVAPLVVNISFGNLPSEQDGMQMFCSDCKRTSPCVGGGSGAWALGTRGHWSCTTESLEASLSANGNRITNLATAASNGDALGMGQAASGDLSGSLPSPIVQTVLNGKAPIYSGQISPQFKQLALPAFRAVGAIAAWGTSTTQAIAVPAGVQSGDLEIAYLILQQTGLTFTPPSGWTLVPNSQVNSSFFTTVEFYHVAGGSEPSSYTFTWNLGGYGDAYITDWYNVNSATPIDSVTTATPINTGASLTTPAPTDPTASDLNLIFGSEQCFPMTLGSPAGALVTSFSPGASNWQESLWSYASPGAAATVNSSAACWKFGTQLALAPALSASASPILNGLGGGSLVAASLTSPSISGSGVLNGSLVGSSPSSSISTNANGAFNVQMFGAKGDGVNADDVGIQAAIEAACAVSPAQVFFPRPANYYKITAPIFIDCNGIRLTGDSYHGGTARTPNGANLQTSFNGPVFVMKIGGTGIDLDAPLITNSTNSARFTSSENYYINLNDVPSPTTGQFSANGQSAFTAQAYIKLSNAADGIVIGSGGRQYAGGPVSNAFTIRINGGRFQADLTVNGVARSTIVDSVDTPTVGVLYHLALVLDPNGGNSTMRFFVNGVSQGTIAYGVAKTVSHPNWETTAVGGLNQTYYVESDQAGGAIQGDIDGVELAKVARYTANFTPSIAEPVADSNTLVKVSFDVNDRILTQVTYGSNNLMWIPVRRTVEPNGSFATSSINIGMDHLNLAVTGGGVTAIGLYAINSISGVFHHLDFGAMYEGMNFYSTSFENHYDDLWISADGTKGYFGINNFGNGLSYFGFGRIDGFPFQFIGTNGSYVLNNFFSQGEADTIWSYIFSGSGQVTNDSFVVCIGCGSDQEGGTDGVYQGTYLFTGVGTAKLLGGGATSVASGPAIQVAQVGTGSFENMQFRANASTAELVHVLAGNVIAPLELTNPNQLGAGRPWTDSPADVIVRQGENTTGIIGSVVNGLQNLTPTVSSCGSGASVAANGTSNAFVITVGTTNPTSSCVVSFGSSAIFGNPPVCTAQDISQGVALKQSSITTSGLTLAVPAGVSDMHGETINVVCIGK